MPARKPVAVGIIDLNPLPPVISIDGISSDHTDAAIITPEANPNSIFCILSGISFFMKNTKDEPSMVPIKGIIIPIINAFMSVVVGYEVASDVLLCCRLICLRLIVVLFRFLAYLLCCWLVVLFFLLSAKIQKNNRIIYRIQIFVMLYGACDFLRIRFAALSAVV